MKTLLRFAALGAILAAAIAAPAHAIAGTIKADGSSTVYPITDYIAAEFQLAARFIEQTLKLP